MRFMTRKYTPSWPKWLFNRCVSRWCLRKRAPLQMYWCAKHIHSGRNPDILTCVVDVRDLDWWIDE